MAMYRVKAVPREFKIERHNVKTKTKTKMKSTAARTRKMQELYKLVRSNFNNADLVYAVDEETGNRTLVFGTVLLNEDPARVRTVVHVFIRQRTSELEALFAAVHLARVTADYAHTRPVVSKRVAGWRKSFEKLSAAQLTRVYSESEEELFNRLLDADDPAPIVRTLEDARLVPLRDEAEDMMKFEANDPVCFGWRSDVFNACNAEIDKRMSH
jgi:hypothetical protein